MDRLADTAKDRRVDGARKRRKTSAEGVRRLEARHLEAAAWTARQTVGHSKGDPIWRTWPGCRAQLSSQRLEMQAAVLRCTIDDTKAAALRHIGRRPGSSELKTCGRWEGGLWIKDGRRLNRHRHEQRACEHGTGDAPKVIVATFLMSAVDDFSSFVSS
eukprot:4881049-Pleurochrysis_carterae.AAC.1